VFENPPVNSLSRNPRHGVSHRISSEHFSSICFSRHEPRPQEAVDPEFQYCLTTDPPSIAVPVPRGARPNHVRGSHCGMELGRGGERPAPSSAQRQTNAHTYVWRLIRRHLIENADTTLRRHVSVRVGLAIHTRKEAVDPEVPASPESAQPPKRDPAPSPRYCFASPSGFAAAGSMVADRIRSSFGM
jgi:hypothetical protein